MSDTALIQVERINSPTHVKVGWMSPGGGYRQNLIPKESVEDWVRAKRDEYASAGFAVKVNRNDGVN